MFLHKIEKSLFYLFLFSIPFQARLVVWRWTAPFNEWTAAFVYGTDILLAVLLILWGVRSVKTIAGFKITATNRWLLLFFLISAISIINADIKGLAWYRLLKLIEFGLLYFYVKANWGKIITCNQAALVIISSGVFQALIAIVQHLKQGSLGLKILGESHIGVDISNVAVFFADGEKYLRSYGTTPHPNVLAAWLFVALAAFYVWYGLKPKRHPAWLISLPILLFGFFLTFSRVTTGLWFLFGIVALIFNRYRLKDLKPLLTITVISVAAFAFIFWPQVKSRIQVSSEEEAVTQRILYNQLAFSTTQGEPLIGIGIGQFTADLMQKQRRYPGNFYQPVHNVYLLIATETGWLGLSLFILFLISLFRLFIRQVKSPSNVMTYLSLVTCLLIFGLFDHFFWTLQQGSLIFWLVLGAISHET